MRYVRFRLGLVVGVAVGVTALSGVLWFASGESGLASPELLRVESLDHSERTAAEDHLHWAFQVIRDERVFTEADWRQRFAEEFSTLLSVDDVNAGLRFLYDDHGPVAFVRILERNPAFTTGLGVADDSVPIEMSIAVDDDGRISGWMLDEAPSPPRLPGLQAFLVLAGGWLFVAAGAAAHRIGAGRQAWGLVVAGILTFSSVLTLSSSSASYSIGRVAPALVLALAVWLLIAPLSDRRRSGALFVAGLAAGLGAIAPLTRDATLIGHPSVLGGFVDDADVYRGLLTGSSLLAGVALTLVAVVTVQQLHAESRWRHPPQWATLAVAVAWGVTAFASALDYRIGDGNVGDGALHTATLLVVATIPLVIAFRQATARWNRPELAGLVIDLESGGGLQPAVARALEDPSVQVLTSPDGERLRTETGDVLTLNAIPADQVITQIRSGGRLVGGLVHDGAQRQQPDRLRAVAAAVGPALEVGRLSEELAAQLNEVRASRRRIIGASDTARRRVERDLHDGAQQRLVALGLDLQHARRLAEAEGHSELARLLESATSDIRGTIEEIRSVSRGSHPALLVERGLGAAVDALAERSPLPVRTEVIAERLPAETEIVAYYVAAEGLANVAKHAAGATRASVCVGRDNAGMHVEVADDGSGGATVVDGSGLQGLDDRVAAAGGVFTVQTGPAGTTLTAVIPCE